jgi:hypothetical protein
MLQLLIAEETCISSFTNIFHGTIGNGVPLGIIGLACEHRDESDDTLFGINDGVRGSEG